MKIDFSVIFHDECRKKINAECRATLDGPDNWLGPSWKYDTT